MTMENLVGKKLGDYEIVEHIGHGAVADVYKASQPKLNRYVAIKVLSPIFADESGFLERFVREAHAVAQLDHPNILPVFDFNRQGNLVYIVMQYVDTGSLDDLLTGQPLPLGFGLRILEQVGSALSYAHSQGIVHRDIKPGDDGDPLSPHAVGNVVRYPGLHGPRTSHGHSCRPASRHLCPGRDPVPDGHRARAL